MLHHLIFVVFLRHFAVFPQSHAFDADQGAVVPLSQKVVEECFQSCSNVSRAQSSVKASNGRSCYQKCLRNNRIGSFLRNWNPKSFNRRVKRGTSTCKEDSMVSNSSICWGRDLTCKDSAALVATGLRVSFHEINKTGKFYASLSWDPLKNNSVEWKGYQLYYIIANGKVVSKCKRFGKNVTRYIVKDPDLELEQGFEFQAVVTAYPLADPKLIDDNITRCRVPTYCPRTASSTLSTTVYSAPPTTSVYSASPPPTSVYSAPPTTSVYSAPPPTSVYSAPTTTSVYSAPPTTSGNKVKNSKGVTILIVSVCAIAVALLGFVSWYFLRSKKTALNSYDIRTNTGEDQYIAKYYHKPLHFEYDAFIIYSTKDQEWVRTTLLPTLEQKHGLKCCIHYRNFAPGVLYRENMVNSVYKSRKTVAVVSPNFFTSGFCESEFEYALRRLTERRDDSLIVIKLDDVDEDKFPMELKQRSYIDYPRSVEKETWETKLVNCLKVN